MPELLVVKLKEYLKHPSKDGTKQRHECRAELKELLKEYTNDR